MRQAVARDKGALPPRVAMSLSDGRQIGVAKICDGKRRTRRLPHQKGQRRAPNLENEMTGTTKTIVAVIALLGAVVASATLAQEGPGGPGGRGGPGAMLMEMFDSMDADADGKLTEAELEAHRAAMFTAADTNSDGMLSTDELSAQHLARFTEQLADRTTKMIEARDNNGDGSLSLAEVDEGPGQRHFARIDSDNDGAISKAEAEAAMDHMGKRKHRKGMGGGMGDGMGGGNN